MDAAELTRTLGRRQGGAAFRGPSSNNPPVIGADDGTRTVRARTFGAALSPIPTQRTTERTTGLEPRDPLLDSQFSGYSWRRWRL
jgi:hypothetical protein